MTKHSPYRIADAHNDLLLAVEHQRRRGISDPFGDLWLPQLRAGGVVLQVLPVYTEDEYVGGDALRRAMILLETARWMADLHPADVAIVENGLDITTVIDSGRIALILALEGGEPLGANLGLVDGFARLGVRIASLTWNRRTMLADGVGERATGGGLTTLGRATISEMERLGIIVDVSHLSDPGVSDVLEVATRPIIATHSSCRALYSHPRNLTDQQIKAVCDNGGIVCLNAFGGFLADNPTVDSYLDHIEHAVGVASEDSVGIGADFIDDLLRIVNPILAGILVDTIPIVPGLRAADDFKLIAEKATERLGADITRKVMGQNLIRHLMDVLESTPNPRGE